MTYFITICAILKGEWLMTLNFYTNDQYKKERLNGDDKLY